MPLYASHRTALLNSLREQADPRAKAWWEGYVKQGAPFLGVKMAAIREIVHDWHRTSVSGTLDPEQQVQLALALFEGRYTEEKLAGTLFLQEILLPAGAIRCARDLDRFGGLFARGQIYDWNVCDWFCIKVLGPLIVREGQPCARRVARWKDSQNLWQARASLVAFVPVAEDAQYHPLIEPGCQTVIRRQERFAKTAVGWILREISKSNTEFVRRFVTENLGQFTAESLSNATKAFGKEERSGFRQMLREAQAGAAPTGASQR
jgi:3-methyladenine DNA glycosylase AlkD